MILSSRKYNKIEEFQHKSENNSKKKSTIVLAKHFQVKRINPSSLYFQTVALKGLFLTASQLTLHNIRQPLHNRQFWPNWLHSLASREPHKYKETGRMGSGLKIRRKKKQKSKISNLHCSVHFEHVCSVQMRSVLSRGGGGGGSWVYSSRELWVMCKSHIAPVI